MSKNYAVTKEAKMQKKIKHLEMIEDVIERMAKNSFQLKGWSMTLVSAIIALSSKDSDQRFILFAIIPIITFGFLDAYYLQQERKYKLLYKNVADRSEDNIDFNMDTRKIVGSAEEMSKLCILKCIFSFSVIPFYVAITATGALLVLWLKIL